MIDFVWASFLILLFPFISFLANGLFLQKNRRLAGVFSSVCALFSCLYATFLAYFFFMGEIKETIAWQFRFLPFAENFETSIGMLLDPISVMMLFVITTVAFLVNLYSIGYMREDLSSSRFFSFLSLFSFSMLGLVISTNIFQMFVFWELVGVSSYLLIGFWYHRPSAVSASKQAFIVTRFADSFFLLGLVIVSYIIQSFDFSSINSISFRDFSNISIDLGFLTLPANEALTLGALFIFIGGWGKSAMFPLHIWLPNAMEGPTPVSSIIHSATMVVAGVYLVLRLFPFFAGAGEVLTIIMVVGAFTSIFSALIACTQKDIKRILAYSTLSQLGYMMFSLGAARLSDGSINTLGYTAASFHIFTHAFFKCMLFLIAGSIIHQVHTNDLDSMGGLWKKMPFAYAASLIGCLSIAGIPPFSGFFSKDEILLSALQSGHSPVFFVGLFTSALTAFYMFRLFFLAFHGKPRSPHAHHAHEDFFMTLPIVLLSIVSLFSGILSKDLFANVFIPDISQTAISPSHITWVPLVASLASLLGILLAAFCYGRKNSNISRALDSDNRSRLYRIVSDKFYFDEAYYTFVREFIFNGLSFVARFFEDVIIGSLVKFCTWTIQKSGALVRTAECGYLPFYLGTLIVGLLLWFFFGKLPF